MCGLQFSSTCLPFHMTPSHNFYTTNQAIYVKINVGILFSDVRIQSPGYYQISGRIVECKKLMMEKLFCKVYLTKSIGNEGSRQRHIGSFLNIKGRPGMTSCGFSWAKGL